ncbi:xanthine dehydrogenase subunit D [Streptomyces sp. NPDC004227]
MTAQPSTGAPAVTPPRAPAVPRGVGEPVTRPDGRAKVRGVFEFSADLRANGMIWGATLRSPHPYARITHVDARRAAALAGVHAVLTAADVPGRNAYGLVVADQPVLADQIVRYEGEPVAVVAADSPEIARAALEKIVVGYEPRPPLSDPRAALAGDGPALHPEGNVVRRVRLRRGDPGATADVVVTGRYEMGMQDQAPLGTESGLAVPSADGSLDLYANTQWMHADRNQLAGILAMPPELIRIHLAGVGGAFGAREDLSLQAHLCLLALRTGRPVKMLYSREESFRGHVHRHPAWMEYEHGATATGELVYVRCSILLDGGAYASTSAAVVANAASFAVGPYDCPNVDVDASVVYTNNPPCGAMRGFGAVQPAFAHEAQMDKLAAALGMDPLDIRLRNAMTEGSLMPTGQPLTGAVPVRDLLLALRDMPPPPPAPDRPDLLDLPGGTGNVTDGEDVRRGVGYGVGFKAGGMPEGMHDYSTARVRLYARDGRARADVQTAAAEVGQGLVTVQQQIVQTELGLDDVGVLSADTSVGSAGSSSASRQTYMTGGAVVLACAAVKEQVVSLAHERFGHLWPDLLEDGQEIVFAGGFLCDRDFNRRLSVADVLGDEVVEKERRYYHEPTTGLDADGQGHPHVQFIFAAHRAVADVDTGTGLCRVVEMAAAQDVGRVINPVAVEGQIRGGTAQGIGLALMEEIQVRDGAVLNPSFTDYLIPTVLDVPEMQIRVLELPDPAAPYGVKGVGEPSAISSTPAVAAALRDATGLPVARVPVRPDDLIPGFIPGLADPNEQGDRT